MHTHSLSTVQHDHVYIPAGQESAERRTRWVIGVTLAMMIAELVAGYLSGSMALIADGWHMGSHAAALVIAAFAYAFSRRHAENSRFTFGTGKVGPLAGYTSAVILAIIAVLMAFESVLRLVHPVQVHFQEAIWVAIVGLIVNLVCAAILNTGHHHGHAHHPHDDDDHAGQDARHHHGAHHHHDINLRAAYMHVVADALTSVLAIVALLGGLFLSWLWMDPAMGIVGGIMIMRWSVILLRESSQVLLDAEHNGPLIERISRLVKADGDNEIADLHLWRVGPQSHACILSVVTHEPRPAEHYKRLLDDVAGLAHVTVEVNACGHPDCRPG
jgi:cation diffusion facilitator family transporter